MRRLFIYLVVAIVVIGALRAMHHRPARHAPAPVRRQFGPAHDDRARRDLVAAEARQAAAEARRALAEAGRELRAAYHEARGEVSRAYREARDELREAYREMVADRGGRPPLPPPPPPPPPPAAAPALEEADGLPVPIVPGTRVTEAEARPPVPAVPAVPARLASRAQAPHGQASASQDPTCEISNPGAESCIARAEARAQHHRAIPGDICANEDRARTDARNALRIKVLEWLSPDVPASWAPPSGVLEAMVIGTKIDPLVKDYGTLYKAELTADFSPMRRAELVDAYNHELVNHRLMTLGGSLAFVLICLAAISGYIRADEATKGYYTNRLRMLAATGVGAAGVIVYRMVA